MVGRWGPRTHCANGSGKSTFLRMLAGFSKPSAGEILWNCHDITESGQPVLTPPKSTVNEILQKYTMFILNDEIDSLYVRCKSRDNELGDQDLLPAQSYNWSFRMNFWGMTLFNCDFCSMTPYDTLSKECRKLEEKYLLKKEAEVEVPPVAAVVSEDEKT
ncbi:non-intrinsic ABC protein 10 [Artemisia annua]|uniref:S-protein homolog n=1 Tax=Artemisia annua TaxID=35608 RepID=A0A2U1NZ17_ARTAN|nr:non-intrinsic ABC protein 10 [Artemisia annua]